MAHSIQDFKAALKGGGARANLFQVELTIPTAVQKATGYSDTNFSILCKAAALPGSNIASVDVPFRGRIFKVAGERTYDPWTITVINDEDFSIRRTMERWSQVIGQYADASGLTNPAQYMQNAKVKQLRRSATTPGQTTGGGLTDTASANGVIATYEFVDIFPTNVAPIDLSYDTADIIEEFTVEFQVQYWRPLDVTDNRNTQPT